MVSEKEIYQLIIYGMTFPDEMDKYLILLLSDKWRNFLITVKMRLLQEIKSMFNNFPEGLYLSEEYKDECQVVIQKVIDKYIRLEQYQLRK